MTGPGIYSYSTTPASNVQANTGINWDEGMSPAAVNNSARQNMTDMRNAFNDLIWFRYGKGDLDYSPVYVASTQFKIAGVDVTGAYQVGRVVKAVGSSTGTIYGVITASAFSTDTTVTVEWDSGSLSNETLTVYLSQQQVTGNPVRGPIRFPATQITSSNVNTLDDYEEGTFTPAITLGGAATGVTYGTQSGSYTKIGNRVCFDLQIILTSKGSSSGSLLVTGLPFTAANTVPKPVSIVTNSLATGVTCPMAVVNNNAATITVYNYNSSTGLNAFSDSTLSGTSNIIISGHYNV